MTDVHPSRLDLVEASQHRMADVAQGTSNATTVVLHSHEGRIAMFAALNAATGESFTVTNNKVHTLSHIFVSVIGRTATAAATRLPLTARVESVANGSFVINVYNEDIAATASAPIVLFRVAA